MTVSVRGPGSNQHRDRPPIAPREPASSSAAGVSTTALADPLGPSLLNGDDYPFDFRSRRFDDLAWSDVTADEPTARRWHDAGLTPIEASEWLGASEAWNPSPEDVAVLREADFTPDEAAEWMTYPTGELRARPASGLSAADIPAWRDALDPTGTIAHGLVATRALDWHLAGFGPDDAAEWTEQGFTFKEAAEWAEALDTYVSPSGREEHVTAAVARSWDDHLPAECAVKWLNETDFDPEQAAAWRYRGFEPLHAMVARDRGLTPEQARRQGVQTHTPVW